MTLILKLQFQYWNQYESAILLKSNYVFMLPESLMYMKANIYIIFNIIKANTHINLAILVSNITKSRKFSNQYLLYTLTIFLSLS